MLYIAYHFSVKKRSVKMSLVMLIFNCNNPMQQDMEMKVRSLDTLRSYFTCIYNI